METEKKGKESQRNKKKKGGGLAHWCDLKRPLLALI